MANENNEQAQETANQPQFMLDNFYLKDLSFEAPNGVNFKEWKPDFKIDGFEITSNKFDNSPDGLDRYESQLKVSVHVKSEDKTAFIAEVHYAGIFTLHGFEQEQLNILLAITCPNMLFPYIRETISGVVIKGGFPPLLLPPPDFEGLYKQKIQEASKEAEKETTN